jgi:hypothetical protein
MFDIMITSTLALDSYFNTTHAFLLEYKLLHLTNSLTTELLNAVDDDGDSCIDLLQSRHLAQDIPPISEKIIVARHEHVTHPITELMGNRMGLRSRF